MTLPENETTEHDKRSWSAKCDHVSRRIFSDEKLKGKTLKFALELLANNCTDEHSLENIISEKLKKGEPLDDYEKSMMEDMYLTHAKLFG